MNRLTKLKLNTFSSLINQVIVLISGLILPKFLLTYYGSEINGLVSSVTQFLSIITFLEMGVGGVVQAALYEPIAKDNFENVNLILSSANKYFKKISIVLMVYVLSLTILFPLYIDTPLDFLSLAFLIVSMSMGLFAQYYFGLVNQILMNADQKAYVHITVQIFTVILNTGLSVLLITMGHSIQVVRFFTGIVYIIRPLYLYFYTKKKYKINLGVKIETDPLPQKWNGVAQHIAYTNVNSTDILLITLFSTLEQVSVYTIYNMVLSGLKLLISSVTNGIQSFFGNLLVRDNLEELNKYFSKIEWLLHTVVIWIFGMAAILIVDFILLYTSGVNDANYNVPIFALIFTISQMIYCIRLPYYSMVNAAGHFKETQSSSIIEALLNIIISLLAIKRFGLSGVAFGTLVAIAYRTLYLVNYLSRNIIFRPRKIFMKLIFVDSLNFLTIIVINRLIDNNVSSFFDWVLSAVVKGLIFLVINFSINSIFYKENMKFLFKKKWRIL